MVLKGTLITHEYSIIKLDYKVTYKVNNEVKFGEEKNKGLQLTLILPLEIV